MTTSSFDLLCQELADFQASRAKQQAKPSRATVARRRIDNLDGHLVRAQRAHAAIGALLGAFEDAREAGEAAERITQKIGRQILTLEGNH